SRSYRSATTGSTGAGTAVEFGLDHLRTISSHMALNGAVPGHDNVPTVMWVGVLPDTSGLAYTLVAEHVGVQVRKWFTPIVSDDLRPALKYRVASNVTVALARGLGGNIPWPEPVRLEEAAVIARYAAQLLAERGVCIVSAVLSLCVRVCLAAQELGLDLTGTTFIGGGEPATPAKVRAIEQTGAVWRPVYG